MKVEEWNELENMGVPGGDEKRFDELMGMTGDEDEHPEDYNGPCFCKLCQSYAD